MQTSYSANSTLTYRGDVITKERVKTAPAKENILFGSGLGYTGTSMLGLQNPSPNKITFSVAADASTVVNGTVTVKTFTDAGVEVSTSQAIAPVTYAVSAANTYALVKAAIELLDSNLTATVTGDTITVIHSSQAVVILSAFTAAGGSAITISYQFDGTILGCAPRAPIEQNSDGTVYYKPGMMVGAVTKGIMTIYSEDAMTLGSSIAIQHMANGAIARGEVRTTTDSGKATAFTSLKPLSVVSADTLANVEINLP